MRDKGANLIIFISSAIGVLTVWLIGFINHAHNALLIDCLCDARADGSVYCARRALDVDCTNCRFSRHIVSMKMSQSL
jgi:hypothetical protein